MRLRGPAPVNPAPPDDVPVFDETPLVAVEFAPRALRPPGRRGPFVAGAWAIAVASLVGVGLLTSEPDDAARPAGRMGDAVQPSTSTSPRALGRPLPSTRMGALLLGQVIDLESPAAGREVRTPRVAVGGSMLVRADHVGISLEALGHVLDHVWIDVFDPDGGIRPDRTPTFATSFDLPFPRPNGTLWVVVTAYDDRGMPLGSTRRPFEVGALGQTGFIADDGKGLDGNWPWGPYYEPPPRVALRAPLPTCLPISTTLASRC